MTEYGYKKIDTLTWRVHTNLLFLTTLVYVIVRYPMYISNNNNTNEAKLGTQM